MNETRANADNTFKTNDGWTARDCGDTYEGHRFYFDSTRRQYFCQSLGVYGETTLHAMRAAMTHAVRRVTR